MSRAWRTCLLAGLLWLAPALGVASITPTLTASRCTTGGETCAAPLAVHFSARGTTCSTAECDDVEFANEAFHSLGYEWDFGDTGAGTWTVSGQDKNLEYGPLAIHVFDNPGTYSVTLTIRSGSESTTQSVDIIVDDPNTVWSGISRCVANTDSFADCPVCSAEGADCIVSADYDQAITDANAAGDRHILFKGGDTFVKSEGHTAFTADTGLVGTFGSGQAIITMTYVGQVFPVSPGIDDWRFDNFNIPNQPAGGGPSAANIHNREGLTGTQSVNKLFYRITRTGGNRAYTHVDEADVVNGWAYENWFVVENDISTAGTTDNLIFGCTRQGGFVGNILRSGFHVFRCQPRWQDVVFSHNELVGPGDRDATFRGNPHGVSQFAVIRENTFRTGCCTFGFSLWPANSSSDHRIADAIIENNHFESGVENRLVGQNFTVRNNTLVTASLEPTGNHGGALPANYITDLRLYNNSGFGTADLIKNGTSCSASCDQAGWTYRNNLLWSASAGPQVISSSGSETASNNFDRDDMASTPYAVATPDVETDSDWYLSGAGASTALDAGFAVGAIVTHDGEGNLRSTADATIDAGAFELNSTAPGVPPGGGVSLDGVNISLLEPSTDEGGQSLTGLSFCEAAIDVDGVTRIQTLAASDPTGGGSHTFFEAATCEQTVSAIATCTDDQGQVSPASVTVSQTTPLCVRVAPAAPSLQMVLTGFGLP